MNRYRINIRFLLIVGIVVVVAGVAIHLQYNNQVKKQAVVLMEQADAAEARGEPQKVIGYLRRYLTYSPADLDTRVRLGFLMSDSAQTPNERASAYMLLDEVLRLDSKRHDIRQKVATLALRMGSDYVPGAQDHLKKLLDETEFPNKGELHALMATGHEIQGEYARAEKALAEAVRVQPNLHTAYLRRALLLRQRLNRTDEADKVFVDPPDKDDGFAGNIWQHAPNRDMPGASVAAAAYWKTCGKQDLREEAVARAHDLAPDDLEVILAVADLTSEKVTFGSDTAESRAAADKAREVLNRGIMLYGPSVSERGEAPRTATNDAAKVRRILVAELFRNRAALAVQVGKLDEAEKFASEGVALLPESLVLLESLADVHIRQGKLDNASRELEQLQAASYPESILDYHWGRILVLNKDWNGAVSKLESAASDKNLSDEMRASALLMLATCYEQIGQPDRRIATLRKAASLNNSSPVWALANEHFAAALIASGQEGEAIEVYQNLVARGVERASVPLGRLLLTAARRRSGPQQDWRLVDRVIDKSPDTADKAILLAEVLLARGDQAGAHESLTNATAKFPDVVGPLLALALLEHRAKNQDQARKHLATARSKFGDSVDVRLTEAQMLAIPVTPETAAGLARLADGASFPPAESRRLLEGISQLAQGAEANDLATQLREQLSALAPNDLNAHLARLDDAIRLKNIEGAKAVLARIKQINGERGSTAKVAEAIVLIAEAQSDDLGKLTKADNLLIEVERERPWWSRAALARAIVADRTGDRQAAAVKYREAVDAGERRPAVVGRLLELYAELQQFRDAEDVLKHLSVNAIPTGSESFVAELSIQAGNQRRALEAAALAVPANSTDPMKLLWLSGIRRLANASVEDVMEPLRRATEVAADQPGPWVALVQYLVAAGRKQEAEAAEKSAGQKIAGPGRPLALAQCLEAVGQLENAREAFYDAQAARPLDPPTLRASAAFYLRANDPDRAEKAFRDLRTLAGVSSADRQYATRLLAFLITSRRDYRTSRKELEAIGLLERGIPPQLTGSETVDELRTRAMALAVQPDAALRREAVATLEAAGLRQPLSADDRFLLARLCLSIGEWPKARGRLMELTRTNGDNLFYQTYFGFALLRNAEDVRDVRSARQCLEPLEKSQPNAAQTIELKARILEAEGKSSEVIDLLMGLANSQPERTGFAAVLLERLGLRDQAEPLYRKLASDPKQPATGLTLAQYLGRQGRTRDALAAVRSVAGKVPPAVSAGVGTEILYNALRVDEADVRTVEDLIAEAERKGSLGIDSKELTAVVRMVQGRYKDAIALYREILARGAATATSLNNLGYLLATVNGQYKDGLDLVRKAQELAGPTPTLRDTEAVILTRMGEAARAVELLIDVTKETADPAAFFHLALAYRALGNKTEEAKALRLAKRWKLRPHDLPPAERAELPKELTGP